MVAQEVDLLAMVLKIMGSAPTKYYFFTSKPATVAPEFKVLVSIIFFKIAQAGGKPGIFLVFVYFFLTISAMDHTATAPPPPPYHY